ncbi:MAG: YeeE/YedE family protein [Colwellia sp.]
MIEFTPGTSFIGGAIIGLSALLLFICIGKIAGISGILNSTLSTKQNAKAWQIAFILGLIISPFIAAYLGSSLPTSIDTSWPVLVIAAFLVGFGSSLGNGCTSGHGICGISRLSKRSIVATCTFMLTAGLTVYLVNHF